MANDAGNDLSYWASVPERYVGALYALRRWPELKMATSGGLIWLKGFTPEELELAAVRQIPLLERYYLREARLYLLGKSLPALIEPTLLWSDLRRGLKIRLPKENFNFFGVGQTHGIELVPAGEERPVHATIVGLPELGDYLSDAPQIRTSGLRWTVLADGRALIIGTPLLPVRGDDYYRIDGFLIPVGWRLRYERMAAVYRSALGDSQDYFYLLSQDNDIARLPKSDFAPLSKGSFVNTFSI